MIEMLLFNLPFADASAVVAVAVVVTASVLKFHFV